MDAASGGRLLAAIAHHLDGLRFPAERQAILDRARNTGAPDDVTGRLEELDDRSYDALADIGKALGLGGSPDTVNKKSGTLDTRNKIDEASAESFPASDPPGYLPPDSLGDNPDRKGR